MRYYIHSLLLLCLPFLAVAQVNFVSTNLPIVKLTTESGEEVTQEKNPALLEIIHNDTGNRNLVSSPANEYSGNCGLKLRGESSLTFAKKSYSLEMWDENNEDIDTSFLGFPAEEDFILYGPFSDKTLMNNVIVMDLARELGQYASRTQYVELMVNGDYRGIYVLMERIKRDKDRVDIAKLRPEDISGDELTGGYIFRIDKGEHPGWTSEYTPFGGSRPIFYQYYYPEEDDLMPEQAEYIESYMHSFESAAMSPDHVDDQGLHYTHYMNLRSLVDHFILSELSKNVDAYRLSTYFHKKKDSNGGKLHMGPIWDYNLSLGNADFCTTDDHRGWLYYECVGNSPAWWDSFFMDPLFQSAAHCRYQELRETILSEENMMDRVNNYLFLLAEPQVRNFQRWDILGQYIWPNSDFFAQAQTHRDAVTLLSDWIRNRLWWMDNNFFGAAEGCERFEDPDFEVGTVSVDDRQEGALLLFPNPITAGELLTIRSATPLSAVSITDVAGQILNHHDITSLTSYSLVPPVMPGTYFVHAVSDTGTTSHIRVIVQ